MKKLIIGAIIFVFATSMFLQYPVETWAEEGGDNPKSTERIIELLTKGAGKHSIIPPGLLTAPGIEKKLDGIDFTAPVISNVKATSTLASTTLITWDTDEDSTSVVYFGTSTGIYTDFAIGSTTATSTYYLHEVELFDLPASTTYYYYVESEDGSGNIATSSEYSFITQETGYTPRICPFYDSIGWENIKTGNIQAAGVHPDVAVATSTIGIVWAGDFGNIYLSVYDVDGNQLSSDIEVYSGYALRPKIVFNGNEFGIFWAYMGSPREIYYSRFNTQGERISNNKYLFDGDYVDADWNGSGYGVSSSGGYFAVIDIDGNKLVGENEIINWGFPPKLVWTGTEYGLTWWGSETNDAPRNVYFTRVDSSGNQIGDIIQVSDCEEWCGYPSIAWNGDSYGLTWMETLEEDTYFTRISSSGNIEVNNKLISADDCRHVRNDSPLVWDGVNWKAVWENADSLAYATLDNDGNLLGNIYSIADGFSYYANSPAIDFEAGEPVVAWNDQRDGAPYVYMGISRERNFIQITSDPVNQDRPAVYGDYLVWNDYRNGKSDLYMYNFVSEIETQITNEPGEERMPSIYGDNIVYQSIQEDITNPGHTIASIYLYNISTGINRKLVDSTEWPCIYENKVVYSKSNVGVYVYDINTDVETKVSSSNNIWSKISGDDIVWYDGSNNLYHYNLITGVEQLIPSVTPNRPVIDGRNIVYGDREGGLGGSDWDVFLYNLDTMTKKRLTDQSGEQQGNYSISGDDVVWVDTSSGNYDVYHYDLSSDVKTQITYHPGQSYHTNVRDGKLVWSDNRDGNHDIYYYEIE